MHEMEPLMTPEEVAAKLNLAKTTVYNMAHRGLIPAIKIGKSLRIRPESLATFLAEQEEKAKRKAA